MAIKTLEQTLYAWLSDCRPDVMWILGDQPINPPAPQNYPAFGTYVVVQAPAVSIDYNLMEYNVEQDYFDERAVGFRKAYVNLDVYSNDQSAPDIMDQVLVSLQFTKYIELFDTNYIGFVRYSAPINLHQIESALTRKRVRSTIEFNVVKRYNTTVERIIKVNPVTADIDRN